MATTGSKPNESDVQLPTLDGVDTEALDRLDAEIPEPDDHFLQTLDAQEEALQAASLANRRTRNALVVLVDHKTEKTETAGTLVAELLQEEGFGIDAIVSVEEDPQSIRHAIETAVVGGADLVVTIGGTGSGPRDNAPEATQPVLDFEVPGIAAALRNSGLAANSKEAALSRGVSGVSGSTVVVNIAGTRSAIRDGMAMLAPLVNHVLDEMAEQR